MTGTRMMVRQLSAEGRSMASEGKTEMYADIKISEIPLVMETVFSEQIRSFLRDNFETMRLELEAQNE